MVCVVKRVDTRRQQTPECRWSVDRHVGCKRTLVLFPVFRREASQQEGRVVGFLSEEEEELHLGTVESATKGRPLDTSNLGTHRPYFDH